MRRPHSTNGLPEARVKMLIGIGNESKCLRMRDILTNSVTGTIRVGDTPDRVERSVAIRTVGVASKLGR